MPVHLRNSWPANLSIQHTHQVKLKRALRSHRLQAMKHKAGPNGTNSVVCHVIETMTLADPDDYEGGAESLWPETLQR
jgi:hypothetical protein